MDIAKRQEISEKYLESIVSVLSKQKFVKALRGKGEGIAWSGLLLNIRSEVSCVSRKVQWHRLPVWMIIRISAREHHPAKHCRCGKVSISRFNEYFDGITLEDLLEQSTDTGDYVI